MSWFLWTDIAAALARYPAGENLDGNQGAMRETAADIGDCVRRQVGMHQHDGAMWWLHTARDHRARANAELERLVDRVAQADDLEARCNERFACRLGCREKTRLRAARPRRRIVDGPTVALCQLRQH